MSVVSDITRADSPARVTIGAAADHRRSLSAIKARAPSAHCEAARTADAVHDFARNATAALDDLTAASKAHEEKCKALSGRITAVQGHQEAALSSLQEQVKTRLAAMSKTMDERLGALSARIAAVDGAVGALGGSFSRVEGHVSMCDGCY